MFFHLFRRNRGPLVQAQTQGERFLRMMLLVAVFAVVCVLFWKQSEKTIEQLNLQGAIADETHTLSSDDKKALGKFAGLFRDEFGMRLKVRISDKPVVLPGLDSKTIFIGMNPSERQVLIELPPLVRRVLGDDFLYDLQGKHFEPYFDSGDWTRGLLEAMAKLWRELSRMSGGAAQGG